MVIVGENMKKGFTLAELLGVIAILGIIAMITVPVIDKSLNQGKSNLSETQEQQLIKGLKDYYAENVREMPKNIGDKKCLKISDLQNNGYLPLDIKNPSTGDNYSSVAEVCATKTRDNNFEYEVDLHE